MGLSPGDKTVAATELRRVSGVEVKCGVLGGLYPAAEMESRGWNGSGFTETEITCLPFMSVSSHRSGTKDTKRSSVKQPQEESFSLSFSIRFVRIQQVNQTFRLKAAASCEASVIALF